MRKIPRIFLCLTLMLPLAVFGAARYQGMSTQILTASSMSTVVAAEFDETVLMHRMAALGTDERMADGYGLYLAVAGHGVPAAHILSYELGEAVSGTMTLSDDDAALSPQDLVILSDPAILHDLRLVTLSFRPLMRDESGTLRFVHQVQVDVATEGGVGLNEQDDPTSFSSAFYPLYHMFVDNLDQIYPEMQHRVPGRYLIVASTARLEQLQSVTQFQSWLDLKKRKGYYVQTIEVDNTTNTGAVRAAISQAFFDETLPDLEYVALLGKVNYQVNSQPDIPTFLNCNPENSTEYRAGDNSYFTLLGSDSLPDVISGRISGRLSSEYATYFAKAVGYETNPYTDDMDWFQSATCVAGNNNDGTGVFPVTPVWNVNWARERLMRDGCIVDADTFYYHSPDDSFPPGYWGQFIQQDIDSGVCMVIYRGWASNQAWLDPYFDYTYVEDLNNGRKLPAVYGVVCGSGNFAYAGGPCLGEYFTTTVGTPSTPKGGITFFGATDSHTNTRHNNAILGGIVEAQLVHGIRGAGAVSLAGKLEGWRQFQLDALHHPSPQCMSIAAYYILHVFNLLGDPEIQVFCCTPNNFDLQYPDQLLQGETLIEVSTGVPNAVATLRQQGSEDISTVRTDAAGMAWLPANFTSTGTAQLTVWKSQYFLTQRDIPIVNGDFDPKITAVNWTAGADNLPNPGETVDFTLTIQNLGTQPTTLTISIVDADSRLALLTSEATVPPLAPGETATSTAFSIRLDGELFDGEHPLMMLSFHDGTNTADRNMQVPVTAPDPTVVSLRVDDGGNGILEPDETPSVYVTIQNVGGQTTSGLTATVSSWDNAIDFPAASLQWGDIAPGGTGESSQAFQAHLAHGVAPGRQIQLRFVFEQNGVVMARKMFTLATGVVTASAPTGPDAYGYYAYEDIDNNNGTPYSATPTYNWIELDPAHGGSGDAHEIRDDTTFTMPLPRSFMYYGQTFDNIWICSNGWFSFGEATISEFRNWEIPSPIGAPSLVAPFWDDLIGKSVSPPEDTLFTMWTRYDSDPGRFIIEWRSFNRRGIPDGGGFPNTAPAIFQAILEFRDGTDGDILFQYDQAANVDTSQNYATIGIEDSYHERGLNLTYASHYPASVDTLRHARAIRFTTTPPDEFLSADETQVSLPKRFALHEAYPNPFNPETILRFDLPVGGRASLRIFDILGREVNTLVDGWRTAGSYRVSFNARDLPSGLYFARLESGENVQVRKLMLLK